MIIILSVTKQDLNQISLHWGLFSFKDCLDVLISTVLVRYSLKLIDNSRALRCINAQLQNNNSHIFSFVSISSICSVCFDIITTGIKVKIGSKKPVS